MSEVGGSFVVKSTYWFQSFAKILRQPTKLVFQLTRVLPTRSSANLNINKYDVKIS